MSVRRSGRITPKGKPTAHDQQEQTYLDVGETLLTESLSTGTDFCKAMIATSTGAIAIYYALFTYVLPTDWRPNGNWESLGVAAPGVLLLIAAILFAVGYLPVRVKFSFNLPLKPPPTSHLPDNSIESAYTKVLSRRHWLATIGIGVFALGVTAAIVSLAFLALAREPIEPATTKVQVTVASSGMVVCGDLIAGAKDGSINVKPSGQDAREFRLADLSLMNVQTSCPN